MREAPAGSAMLVANAGLFTDDGVPGVVRLGNAAGADGAFFGRGIGRHIAFATAEKESRKGQQERGKDGFHVGRS